MLLGKALQNGVLGLPLHEPPLPRQSVSSSQQELRKAGLKSLQTLVCFAALCVQHPVEPGQAPAGVVPLFQRLGDLIFVSDNTVKLLELSAMLMMPLFMLLGHILLGLRFKAFHCLSLLRNQLGELLHFMMGCCVCMLLLTHMMSLGLLQMVVTHTHTGFLNEGMLKLLTHLILLLANVFSTFILKCINMRSRLTLILTLKIIFKALHCC